MSVTRFEDVKYRVENGWPNANRRLADIVWLVAEVERLRADRASYIADAATALAELRAGQ